ncbi:hypothetical protein E4U43_006121 [Claviceps pusilla]|uniref:Uncharacterized protein n=1 Tax=Claviceps pusilla TaxID=123648 RepID=A0A9P7NFY8_9HYPO|nr:hypothetical protein E4U43_006121 [Claviceps pusilla]
MENTDKTRPERSESRQGIIPSAQGSINAIIREHGGQQLFVPAIAWTTTHLDLLNIQFIDKKLHARAKENQDVQVGTAPQNNEGHLIFDEKCLRQLKELGELWPDEREFAIANLLTTFGFEKAKTRGPQDANKEKEKRFAIRHNGFGVVRWEYRYCAAKIGFQFGSRIIRRARCEDPYIAGILIALAQEQRRRGVAVVEDGEEHDAGQRVHAIGYQASDNAEVFIYTALIPDGFLNEPVEAADFLLLYWKTVGLVHEGESNPGRQQ